jgi:carboxymethylenebutenolidase
MNGMHLLVVVFCALAVCAPAQDFAKERLDKSSRHGEWVQVKSGDRLVHSFVVYPEVKQKVPVVLVIHENQGLTDWVRSVADQLAEAGYIAVAPDLLSGMGPNSGKTSDFPPGAARDAIYKLEPGRVTEDLNAVADYAAKIPAGNGKVAVAGFCWGGGQSFRFAANHPTLAAAFVFYGTGPDAREGVVSIKAPVYGFYGGNDARVNATIPKTAELMKEAGKKFDPVIYEEAGHGFMRAGEAPDASPANRKAREEAWVRWKAILRTL